MVLEISHLTDSEIIEKNKNTYSNIYMNSLMKHDKKTLIDHFNANQDSSRFKFILSADKPFKPSRCIKASFYITVNILNFPTTEGFIIQISTKLIYKYMVIFLVFHPLQIISSTTSRELRQQFTACSG